MADSDVDNMTRRGFEKEENRGLRHFINALRFSFQGLQSAFTRESAFRQELLLFAVVLPTGAWHSDSVGIFVALVCACLLVLTVELLNSGIEAAVDRIGLEHHDMAKLAKDYGSAAVMMSLCIVMAIWAYIVFDQFIPPG